jgi:GntR family carbon starvation induced transcriptional regulator
MLATEDKLETISDSPRNQTSAAYETIRADIIAGAHPPGKKLKVQDLAEDLNVSPGAVREALSRLVPEQLVISRDQRGFVVAPLSISDLEDLTDLRCEIESIALKRSVELGDIDWEVRVLAAAHKLRALPRPQPGKSKMIAGWVTAHKDYHNALISACGSRRLIALHAQLYEQSERYRSLSAFAGEARDIVEEHQTIADLALTRDSDGLIKCMVGHIRETTDLIIAAAKNQVFPS